MELRREFNARARKIDHQKQPLADHLSNVGQICKEAADRTVLGEIAQIAGWLHDAGKATGRWQEYLENALAGKKQSKIDHATAGAWLLAELLDSLNLPSQELLRISPVVQAIQAVVMYHHGSGLPDFITPDGSCEFLYRLDRWYGKTESEEIRANFPQTLLSEITGYFGNSEWRNKAFDILVNEFFSPCSFAGKQNTKKSLFCCGLQLRRLSSLVIDADRSDSADFDGDRAESIHAKSIPDWDKYQQRLNTALEKMSVESSADQHINAIRQKVSDWCFKLGQQDKGIYSCSASTGSGKTLAALRFGLEQAKKHDLKHIIIVAPYTSIIDQNADLIRKILEHSADRGQVVLECHSNLSDTSKEQYSDLESGIYEQYAASWTSPIIVTTMVQFLETLFGAGTKKIRRMHQLADSVLIFDEIQTLPVKTTFMFNWGLDFLVSFCGCSALLCTATQPGLNKLGNEQDCQYRITIKAEVIKDQIQHLADLKRVNFIDLTEGGTREYSCDEVSTYIVDQMQNVGSFLAVVNTRPQARELYELLKGKNCAEHIYYLSTDLCPLHRRKVIAEIKERINRQDRIVCVSTRLIEAGVDLSFGGALRYLAGLDSVIQTAGRCNRNGELKDHNGNLVYGRTAIVCLKDENISKMPELKAGQDCLRRVLREYSKAPEQYEGGLCNPELVERYFKYFYELINRNSDVLACKITGSDVTVLDLLSDNCYAISALGRSTGKKQKCQFYHQAFKTAWSNFEVISDTAIGVIVPYLDGSNLIGQLAASWHDGDLENRRTLMTRMQQYTVNVFVNRLQQLVQSGSVYEIVTGMGVYALHAANYDAELGLMAESANGNFTILSF